MTAPHTSETFLDMFGTPTLLWRMLSSLGYEEPLQYTWREADHAGSLPWVDVQITVPPCPNNPQWLGWVVESDGQTPWEGAQVAALEVLLEICQDFGDELVNGPAGSLPRVSVTDTFVSQIGTEPLEIRETMLGYSSSPAMSAMLAVLKLYYVRQDTYVEAMLALQQAQAGQRKLRKHVRKHRKACSDAQAEIQNYHTAQARRNQV